jgi:FSR family fosmidomycin resistance protein-like MFS transporter
MTTTTVVSHASAAAEPIETERFHATKVTLVSFGHFVHDTYTAFLAPLLPAFIAKYALSTTQAGLLSVFYQWPSLIQPYIGYLADRTSLRYLFILAPAITATMMCLLGVAPSYAVMVMLLLIAGVSSAGLHAVGAVIAGMQSGRHLGRGMSFWMVGGEAGRALGPIIVVSAVTLWGLQGVAWLMLGGWLASGVLFIWLRNVADRPATTAGPRPWRPALRAMRPVLLPVAGIMSARTLLIAALTTYLPTFLNSEGLSLWWAGAALSVMQVAAMGGALAGGPMSDRWGRRSILAASLGFSALFMFLFLGAQGWVAIPLLLLLGFSSVAVMPVSMALVQESFPQDRALANGIYMAINFLVLAIGVLALGALADRLGLRAAFTISAAVALLGLPLILLLPRRSASPTHR